MSGDGVQVDHEELRSAAKKVKKVQSVSEALKELESKIEPHYTFGTWGIVGKLVFATVVDSAVQTCKDALSAGSSWFETACGDMHDAATKYESRDDTNAGKLGSVDVQR